MTFSFTLPRLLQWFFLIFIRACAKKCLIVDNSSGFIIILDIIYLLNKKASFY